VLIKSSFISVTVLRLVARRSFRLASPSHGSMPCAQGLISTRAWHCSSPAQTAPRFSRATAVTPKSVAQGARFCNWHWQSSPLSESARGISFAVQAQRPETTIASLQTRVVLQALA
jgi:hypothetical protein